MWGILSMPDLFSIPNHTFLVNTTSDSIDVYFCFAEIFPICYKECTQLNMVQITSFTKLTPLHHIYWSDITTGVIPSQEGI